MIIVAGRLHQLHDRKPCFRRSLTLRIRAEHSRCSVASQTPKVALLWQSRKTFPYLQHRIRVRYRAVVSVLIVIGLAPLSSHHSAVVDTVLTD